MSDAQIKENLRRALAEKQAADEARSQIFVTSFQLRSRYGGVSHMGIERRLGDDAGFPKPTKFGRLRFWRLADIEAWERSRAGKP
jgi:hypothetical protein